MNKNIKPFLVASNKLNRTVTIVDVPYYDTLRQMFRFGLLMPDGGKATGIGRVYVATRAELEAKVLAANAKLI